MSKDKKSGINRRQFIQTTSTLAAAAGAAGVFLKTGPANAATVPKMDRSGVPDKLETDSANVDVKYTVCLNCHSGCGLKVRVSKGSIPAVLKVDGSPFHPNCIDDDEGRIEMGSTGDLAAALKKSGTCCPKGQASAEILYNPYRILAPLKRQGARGSGKWKTLTWTQAISEIATAVLPYWTRGPDPTYTGSKTGFLINPNNPSLGYKNNHVVMSIGRLEHGQKEFTDRWFKTGFGTQNYRLDHTSTCEPGHHVGLDFVYEKKKHHTKPDFANAKFVLIVGANVLEAGFPMQTLARKMMRAMKKGTLRVAVADPVFIKGAAKANYWLPVKPTTDAAMAFAIARSWLDNSTSNLETDSGNQIDTRFLRNATKGAADADKELDVADATWLVRRDNREFYRDTSGNLYVWSGGAAVSITAKPNTATTVVHGILQTGAAGVTVNGVLCDSVFELLSRQIKANTVTQWAGMCGLPVAQITAVAGELAKAGKQGCVEFYRGPGQYTGGTYAIFALASLNIMRGNGDHKGGIAQTGGGHWHEMGGKATGQASLMSTGNATAYAPVGPRLDRAKGAEWSKYKGSDTVPQRPWFPHANHGAWQELIPSIGAKYPYACKVLFSYWANPLYTTPAQLQAGSKILADTTALPLHVCFDVDFGETAVMADYILPDTTYLERSGTPHIAPAILTEVSGLRQPMVGSYDSAGKWTSAVGDTMQLEDFFIALGKKLASLSGRKFPGIGTGGFVIPSGATGFSANCDSSKQWFDNIVRNLAVESGFTSAQIRARGGVFEKPGTAYTGTVMNHRYKFKTPVHLYYEKLAQTTDWMTGKKHFPMAQYQLSHDIADNLINDDPYQFPFQVVTWKPVQHKQAVTAVCPTLMMLEPTNFILINSADARTYNLESGDKVKLTSATNSIGVVGKVATTEGMRPGVLGVSMGFGHWEMSSKPSNIDGKVTGYDRRRGKGVHINPVLRMDPILGDVCLQDKVAGGASYFETRIRLEKV